MKNTILFLFSFIVITSCTTEINFENVQLVRDFTNSYIDNNKEVFEFDDAQNSIEFITKDNCKVKFEPNSFVLDDEPYLGRITIEFVLVYDRPGMILSGMPTMYSTAGGTRFLLESGGEFWIKAYDSVGNLLSLAQSEDYIVEIPKSLTNIDSSAMKLFSFREANSLSGAPNSWISPFDGFLHLDETGENYIVVFNQFEWINCDDFLDFDGKGFNVNFTYPPGFTAENSFTFLSLKNYPNSLATLDLLIPNNEECQLIFVARDDTHFHIASESFVVTADMEIDFTNKDLSQVDIDEAANYLSEIIN